MSGVTQPLPPERQQLGVEDRLDSWKEIATYLKRSVRTVRRWESEQGLPVHRHLHHSSGTVYAYKPELDAWWASRSAELGSATGPPEAPRAHAGFKSAGRLLLWILLGMSVLAALLVVLNVGNGRDRLLGLVHPPSIGSIAVLPLENLTGDRALDSMVDAMTDALTTELARARLLGVSSRTSATRYKGAQKSLRNIAKELNVDALIEGTVSRSGERVHVNTQLIHASSDRHLWAQRYDRDLKDLANLPSEIAWDILRALPADPRFGEQPRLAHPRPASADAYEAYIKGRFFWNKRGAENLLKALRYFQQAIQADPSYAPAYSGLSDTYRLGSLNGLAPPRDCMPKAEAAARKALELDDTLAEAHASLAGVLYRYHWDWTGAEKEFRRALELDPNYEEAHRAYGVYLLSLNRNEVGLAHLQQARQLSPLSAVINTELAAALVRVGRFDEAIEQLKKTLEIDPNFGRVPLVLASAYEGKGDSGQALAALEQTVARSRRGASPWLGYGYAVTGRRREAQEVLATLEERSNKRYVSPQSFAIVYIGLGDKEKALAFLEKSYEERSLELLNLTEKWYDPLRSEPRFQSLLRRVGLPVERNATRPDTRTARSSPAGSRR